MNTRLIWLVVATMIVEASDFVRAECLIPPPPCQALSQASLVVIADVLEATQPWVERSQVVTLNIIERFKDVLPSQKQLTLKVQSNVETVFLEKGKRYLIYAFQVRPGEWGTSCSRTRVVTDADPELKQLRQCRRK
jgi:hypothetical protein